MKPPIYHRMFSYNLSLLPNPQLAVLEHGVTTIDQARQKSGATIGYPGWGLIYHLLLSHLDRSREEIIIETGTNWGSTTIVLAQALVDAGCKGRVITFELDPDNVARASDNLHAAGVADRVELHPWATASKTCPKRWKASAASAPPSLMPRIFTTTSSRNSTSYCPGWLTMRW